MINYEYAKLLVRHSILCKVKDADKSMIELSESAQIKKQLLNYKLKLPTADILETTKYAFPKTQD